MFFCSAGEIYAADQTGNANATVANPDWVDLYLDAIVIEPGTVKKEQGEYIYRDNNDNKYSFSYKTEASSSSITFTFNDDIYRLDGNFELDESEIVNIPKYIENQHNKSLEKIKNKIKDSCRKKYRWKPKDLPVEISNMGIIDLSLDFSDKRNKCAISNIKKFFNIDKNFHETTIGYN